VVVAAIVAERAQGAPVEADIAQCFVVQGREDTVIARRRTPGLDGFQDIQDHRPLSS
jgi:hypothetical protein